MRSGTATLLVSLLCLAPMTGCYALNKADAADRRSAGEIIRNQHADLTTRLSRNNVDRLQLAWKIETEEEVSHRPLVQNGRVYFADWGGKVYAADGRTGKVLWEKTVEKPMEKWPWYGFSGTGALGEGLLFEASVEGNAFALDQETGQLRWQVKIADDPQAGNLSKLMYHDGKVFVGLSSVEEPMTKMKEGFKPNFQGKVLALDAKTGKKLWERPLVTPPHNGVAVWSGFAIDPGLDLLYFTTSNNYTGVASELSDAIVAVDPESGAIRWFRQVYEHDTWTMAQPHGPDYAFAAAPQLFEATVDGKRRNLVGAGNKSGVFFVWDRETGEQVWTTTAGYGQVGGGIHAEASIGDGRIYLWGNNSYPYQNPAQHPMDIKAVDAASGRYLWVKTKAQPAVLTSAGFLANDVYFVGSLDGKVRAYGASDGQLLWTSPQQGSISSSLWVDGETLYFGTGVPKRCGGREGPYGVYAYRPR